MHRSHLEARARRRLAVAIACAAIVLAAGLRAAQHMEASGHVVTGMNNAIVWGLPHVFAIFLIVAASGVLNVASIASVFGQADYAPRAPLSALLCIALLAGGLLVLTLDLGRPERVLIAATRYNARSVFAWNVLLYSGMFAIAFVYLGTLLQPRLRRHSKNAGLAAFAWRLVLTGGTGSIFGFVAARDAWGSALLAPLFIAMSFSWGLAVFLVAQAVAHACSGETLPVAVHARMTRLLGVFIGACLYLVAVQHLTNLYFARNAGVERFLLVDGGIHPLLFWAGFVVLGSLAPLVLIFGRGLGRPIHARIAAILVIGGALCWLYAFVIGGQAWPVEPFRGAEIRSAFGDGRIAIYAPTLPEWLLGLAGCAFAFLVATLGSRLFDVVPHEARATLDTAVYETRGHAR